jgi:hypothetical protein
MIERIHYDCLECHVVEFDPRTEDWQCVEGHFERFLPGPMPRQAEMSFEHLVATPAASRSMKPTDRVRVVVSNLHQFHVLH